MFNVNRLSKKRKSKACYNTNGPWKHTQYKEANVKGCTLRYIVPTVCGGEKLRVGKPKESAKGGGAGVENDVYEHRVLSEVRGILGLDSAAGMWHCELSKTTTYSLCMRVVSIATATCGFQRSEADLWESVLSFYTCAQGQSSDQTQWLSHLISQKPHSKCWLLEELCIHFLFTEKNGIPPSRS